MDRKLLGTTTKILGFVVIRLAVRRKPHCNRSAADCSRPPQRANPTGNSGCLVAHRDLDRSQRELVQISGADACVARDSKRQPGFRFLFPCTGIEITLRSPRFGIDMVTPMDASQCPTVRLNQPARFLAGDRFQTAASRIRISNPALALVP
jgi:hypothetical protein